MIEILNTTATIIGLIMILLFGGLLILGLLIIIYSIIDYIFKRLLGWQDIENRRNIIYFIKNKEKIKEYIQKEKNKK